MAKLNRNKYFVGTKKLKRIKLFEEFFNESFGNPIDDEPSYYVLTDGRFLFFSEQDFGDMAGETNYYYKYFVGKPGDKDPENAEETSYKDVEKLLNPEDKKQHEEERKQLADDNGERSKRWVESKTEKSEASVNETAKKYWMGNVQKQDDFGDEIVDVFIDGKTNQGPWGFMTPESWKKHGVGKLGTGFGQKYKKQDDGKWLKIEG